MNKKFWYLTKQSLNKKIKSKWFLVANIIILIAMIAVINIDKIIDFFGGDFNESNEILIIDETGYSYNYFLKNLDIVKQNLDFDYEDSVTIVNDSIDNVKKSLDEDNKILIVLYNSENSYLDARIISKTYIDTSYYQYLYQALTTTKVEVSMLNSNIDVNELNKITSNLDIDRQILNEDETSEDEIMNTVMSTVFPTIILPFFILVIFLVQMIGTEINEEKSSRSMEIIISNVSPTTHFASKILAANSFVIIQGALLILYGVIAFLIRNMTCGGDNSLTSTFTSITNSLSSGGIIDKLGYIIPLTLILLLLSFLAYSLVAGILASMTVSMEDFQQIQTPIVFTCLIGYYLAIMAGLFKGSLFIRILSYTPFFSCLLSPVLLIMGDIKIIDVIISILVLIIFNYILAKKGIKVYKVGILNYSSDKMWTKILRAIKK